MLSEGQVLENKYRVDRLLARGGMGAVFVGQHMRIKRKVAIKVLHIGDGQNDALRRFEKEAQAAGQIGSDHIVEVLDIGTTPEGDRFMVMEFLDGEPLKQRIRARGRLTPTEAVPIIIQLLEGLAAAHDASIIHRDLKPDNVFLLREKAGRKDFVKIVDFGISKFGSLNGEAGEMTQAGAVMGTPFYMSPEQARSANEVDSRSDLYAVGVILYQALAGVLPFQATTFAELLFKIVFEVAPHLKSIVPDLDDNLSAIVMKAMAREPADRYQSARDLQLALERWYASNMGLSRTNVHANLFQSVPKTTQLPSFEDPTLGLDSGSSPGMAAPLTPSWTGQQPYPPLSQSQNHQPYPALSQSQNQPGLAPGSTAPSLPSVSSPGQPWGQYGPDLSQSGSISQVQPMPAGAASLDTQKSWNTSGRAPKNHNGVIAFAIIGSFAVLGVVAGFFITRDDSPSPAATAASAIAATTTSTSAMPDEQPAPPIEQKPAPTAELTGETSAEPAATASAEPATTAEPTTTAEPVKRTTPIRRTTPTTPTAKPPTTTTPAPTPTATAPMTTFNPGY